MKRFLTLLTTALLAAPAMPQSPAIPAAPAAAANDNGSSASITLGSGPHKGRYDFAPTEACVLTAFSKKPMGLSVVFTSESASMSLDMPNIDGIESQSWQKYRTSIRAIEEKTGYDFLQFLPGELQDRLEGRIEIQSKRNRVAILQRTI